MKNRRTAMKITIIVRINVLFVCWWSIGLNDESMKCIRDVVGDLSTNCRKIVDERHRFPSQYVPTSSSRQINQSITFFCVTSNYLLDIFECFYRWDVHRRMNKHHWVLIHNRIDHWFCELFASMSDRDNAMLDFDRTIVNNVEDISYNYFDQSNPYINDRWMANRKLWYFHLNIDMFDFVYRNEWDLLLNTIVDNLHCIDKDYQ